MAVQSIPQTIIAKHPELMQALEAISAYKEGREIAAHCPTCDNMLVVTDLPEIGSLWVTCAVGCTNYHQRYESQAA